MKLDHHDIDLLKARIDLRVLVQSELGNPVRRNAGSWSWRCPFHDEQSGTSLAVWANGWRCFGKCSMGGDVLAWLMRRHNVSFPRALQMIGGDDLPLRKPAPPATARLAYRQAPGQDWQAAALEGVDRAQWFLLRPEGENALRWLRFARGLQKDTIREAQIGYNPMPLRLKHINPDTRKNIVLLPGIVLPWFAAGQLWAVRVRTHTGALAEALGVPDRGPQLGKYMSLRGSSSGGLYWADRIIPGWPVFITEGEINCLSLWQDGMDRVCPVSLGSASTTINPRWYAHLATASVVYAYFDPDEAGNRARERLGRIAGGVRFVKLPEGVKDINDLAIAGRRARDIGAVSRWLRDVMAREGEVHHAD